LKNGFFLVSSNFEFFFSYFTIEFYGLFFKDNKVPSFLPMDYEITPIFEQTIIMKILEALMAVRDHQNMVRIISEWVVTFYGTSVPPLTLAFVENIF
jgi:hypothetical protein